MERILTSIDVGTSKVCTMVARMEGGDIVEVLGTGVVTSHGIQKAIVLDITEPTIAIRNSVEEAERSSGIKIESAYIGITGSHVKSFNNQATIDITRGNHLITRKDIEKVIKASKGVSLVEDRQIIHAIPRRYRVDGQVVPARPEGLHGYRLGVETHIITAGITFIQNLVKCVQGAGVGVMDLIMEPLASSEAVLEAAEKEQGVILADIGAGTTDITVFKERDIWHSSALPVAGTEVTRDIAIGLGLPFNIAEELKVKYGSVTPNKKGVPDVISVNPDGKYGVSYQDFCYIIRARLEEIIKLLFVNLPRGEWETWEPGNLVFTGGASNVRGIEALGKEILGIPVRVGRPIGLPEEAAILDNPAYSTGVGLLLWGARYGATEDTTAEGAMTRFYSGLRRIWARPELRRLWANLPRFRIARR
ncbi:cell division protein FtsA [Chloroflexota bacterium]